MKPIRKYEDIEWKALDKCHEGEGVLYCQSLFDGCDPVKLGFMHRDEIKAGVSIGEHEHTSSEEVYYLVSGKGILTYDGKKYEMRPGDVSLCNKGHSHAFLAIEDCILIVVG